MSTQILIKINKCQLKLKRTWVSFLHSSIRTQSNFFTTPLSHTAIHCCPLRHYLSIPNFQWQIWFNPQPRRLFSNVILIKYGSFSQDNIRNTTFSTTHCLPNLFDWFLHLHWLIIGFKCESFLWHRSNQIQTIQRTWWPHFLQGTSLISTNFPFLLKSCFLISRYEAFGFAFLPIIWSTKKIPSSNKIIKTTIKHYTSITRINIT